MPDARPACRHGTWIATASWMRCASPPVTTTECRGTRHPAGERDVSPDAWRAGPGSPSICRSCPQAKAKTYSWSSDTAAGTYGRGAGRYPRIELRTQECRVTLDFTHAVFTSDVLRIETDMVHGKLFIVSSPCIVIDTDGLSLTYSKLHSTNTAADPRLRLELAGKLLHAKVIEQRP